MQWRGLWSYRDRGRDENKLVPKQVAHDISNFPVILSGKILRNSEGEMISVNPQCHAELVSVPHMLSVLHAGHLSCGIPKQVRDDFRFSTCHG
jgi:hypothetical protein